MASSCVVRHQEHSSERFFEHSWLLNPEGYQGRSPWLVSVPIGDGGNPSPSGEARFGVTWSRATVPAGSAHEERPEGSPDLGSEVPEAGADRGCRDSGARPATPNHHGA